MTGRALGLGALVVTTTSALLAGLCAAVPAQAAGGARAGSVAKAQPGHHVRSADVYSHGLRPVELPGERTATSRTYLLPGGTRRVEAFTAPVNYRNQSGRWARIDNRLVGSSRPGYVAENAANGYRLQIPADGGADPVRFEAGGRWVAFSADGVKGGPRVQGSMASFTGPAGTRLEYQAVNTGAKETIVLTHRPVSAPGYVFTLRTSPGLVPRVNRAGGLDFAGRGGAVVFGMPAPFMVDGAGGWGAVSVGLAAEGSSWRLTLRPDRAWLADRLRVYPVRIDPTLTLKPAALDCYIADSQTDQNLSHCSADYIRVGPHGENHRGLVKFDLSQIPANATVSSADLALYLDSSQTPNPGVAADYVARQVLDRAWTSAATWNKYDGVTAWTTPGGDFGTTDAGRINGLTGTTSGYKDFAPTSLVQSWVNGTVKNRGFLLKQVGETTDNEMVFFSSDSGVANEGKWPKLTVQYTEPGVSPFARIGDREFLTYETQQLDDRMTAKVNVATGNLLVSENDLRIAGTGLDAGVSRYYNSVDTGTDPAGLTPGWVLGDAPTVRLEFPGTTGRVTFVGPSGYRVRFDKNADRGYAAAQPGIHADLTFDSAANQYSLTWWGSDEKWVFDGTTGHLNSRADRQGNTITYTYGTSGQLDHLTDTQGRRINFTYDAGTGLLEAVTDAAGGRTYDYRYAQFPPGSGPARLASVAVTSYGLGSDNVNLNVATSFDYDSSGRLTTITDPRGNTTRVGYDGTSGRVATFTRVTKDTSDTDPVTTFSYTGGNLADCNDTSAVAITTVNGPRTDVSDITKYCTDDLDRIVDTIDAQGHLRSVNYTSVSNVNSFNDTGVSGQGFNFTYDSSHNQTGLVLPTDGSETASYNDPAHPHLPSGVRDFATTEADPLTWAYTYDPNGYLIQAQNSAQGITYHYCYDGKGQLQRVDPPDQGANSTPLDTDTTTGCGTANQGGDTLLSYDTAGNLTTVDPPGAHGTKTFTYDAVSRVHTITDGRGVVQTFTYDALDHLTRIDYSDPSGVITTGVAAISYGYDTNGNLVSRSETSDNTNYTYDDLNRLIKQSPAAPAAETDYTYDPAGNLASIDVSDQTAAVSYGYDNLNRVTSVTDQRGASTTFGYNNVDQRTTTSYPNGVTQKQAYDSSHRLTCIYSYTGTPPATGGNGCPSPSTSLISFRSYGYTSPAGLDTTNVYTNTNRSGDVTTYSYDAAGRLTEARRVNGSTVLSDYQYTLGDHNTLTRQAVTGTSVPNATTSYGHSSDLALCWSAPGAVTGTCSSPPAGATTYSFDNAGNLASTSDGLSASYNLQNQNSQLTPSGGQPFTMSYVGASSDRRTQAGGLLFSYDLLGLNTQGTNSGVPHSDWFARDPSGTLVVRRDSNSNNSNTRDLFYLFDGQGSVSATTGSTGAVVHRYSYTPYGQEAGADPADDNPWRYASGYSDTATGMTKFGTRYYQPSLMNWTQTDPVPGILASPMTLNPYAYTGSNPINYADPTGLIWQCLPGETDCGVQTKFANGDAFHVPLPGDDSCFMASVGFVAAVGGTIVNAPEGPAAWTFWIVSSALTLIETHEKCPVK